jgi:hypothetical protein
MNRTCSRDPRSPTPSMQHVPNSRSGNAHYWSPVNYRYQKILPPALKRADSGGSGELYSSDSRQISKLIAHPTRPFGKLRTLGTQDSPREGHTLIPYLRYGIRPRRGCFDRLRTLGTQHCLAEGLSPTTYSRRATRRRPDRRRTAPRRRVLHSRRLRSACDPARGTAARTSATCGPRRVAGR